MPTNRDEPGFTLIELLVVIMILGILAAISIPSLMRHQRSAQVAMVTSDVRAAAMYLELERVQSEGEGYNINAISRFPLTEDVTLVEAWATDDAFCITFGHASNPDAVRSWDTTAGGIRADGIVCPPSPG